MKDDLSTMWLGGRIMVRETSRWIGGPRQAHAPGRTRGRCTVGGCIDLVLLNGLNGRLNGLNGRPKPVLGNVAAKPWPRRRPGRVPSLGCPVIAGESAIIAAA